MYTYDGTLESIVDLENDYGDYIRHLVSEMTDEYVIECLNISRHTFNVYQDIKRWNKDFIKFLNLHCKVFDVDKRSLMNLNILYEYSCLVDFVKTKNDYIVLYNSKFPLITVKVTNSHGCYYATKFPCQYGSFTAFSDDKVVIVSNKGPVDGKSGIFITKEITYIFESNMSYNELKNSSTCLNTYLFYADKNTNEFMNKKHHNVQKLLSDTLTIAFDASNEQYRYLDYKIHRDDMETFLLGTKGDISLPYTYRVEVSNFKGSCIYTGKPICKK